MLNSNFVLVSKPLFFGMRNNLGPLNRPECQELGEEVWTNQTSEQARDTVLMSKPMFYGMGNHLGPEASNRPEGHELCGNPAKIYYYYYFLPAFSILFP